MRKGLILALAPALAVLASCLPTDCGCALPEPIIEIRASVEDSSGTPVAGAGVTLQQFSPTCAGAHVADLDQQVTGTDGRLSFVLYEVPPPACFLVRASGPAGSGLGSTEATLQHTAEAPLAFGTDPATNRIDIILRLEETAPGGASTLILPVSPRP